MTVFLYVQRERCKTCIFGPNSPIGRERFAELRRSWEERGAETFQVCHQWGAWDPDDEDDEERPEGPPVVCRGFFEEIYQERGIPVAALQLAERLGVLGEYDVERTG